jgi:glycosyltransferase involved in cell wall biosynthesis
MLAARAPALQSAAEALLRQLDPAGAAATPGAIPPQVKSPATSGLDPCPCGSGKSRQQCCGRTVESATSEADRVAQEARRLFLRGEAFRAKSLIDTLVPANIGDPELLHIASDICVGSGSLEQAYAFLDRSAKLTPSARTAELLTRCCNLLWKDCARGSAHGFALRLRERIEKRATPDRSPTNGPIHVLGTLGTIGGSETRAVSLYRALSARADVRLWSAGPPLERQYAGLPIHVIDPVRGEFPNGGTLILAGHYFDPGDWWRSAAFDRVVICVNLDFPLRLVRLLTDIEESPRCARIDFTFPSVLARNIFGLPGSIEYPLADVSRFTRATPARHEGTRLAIGRHSRDDRSKHHPNDPAIYRELVARGHRLRLLGATCLRAAFSEDPAASAIEMLPTGSEDPRDFLSSIDCFLYRKHPNLLETGGTAIFEAMAMALPTVVFRDGVGAAEIIEHGREGFLVDTDQDALACIDRLAADPGLRAAVGAAARRKVSVIMQEQQQRILAYYLGADRSFEEAAFSGRA